MHCPFCDQKLSEGPHHTPELENGFQSTCPDCGFGCTGRNMAVVAVAIETLNRHIGDVLVAPDVGDA